MPTGQHQLCMLRTISNRIRIEYIWLQHMIQVRILGNNKGARHPQDLRQWPLSFLLCQTPAFLQQSFFPTKVCFPHQLPRTAHFIRFGRLIWLIVGMARSGIVTFHAMVVYTGQHPIVDTFIDSTFKNLLAPPRLLDILNRFLVESVNRVEFNGVFSRSQTLPRDPVRFPRKSRNFPEFLYIVLRNLYIVLDHFIYSSEKFIYSSNTKLNT